MVQIKKTIFFISIMSIWGADLFAGVNKDINDLKNEINNIKSSYEERITNLEEKLNKQNSNSITNIRNIYDNQFNPSNGVILNGKYSNFSKESSEIAGFAIGEEGKREKEGFSIYESELNFSSNIDDKFFGSMTAAIVREDGEDKIELEESFIQTTPGFGLPTGLAFKAGRAFWTLGYLNEQHVHSGDFAERPLSYRAFLNKAFNDDGVQISYLLPTDFYTEIGSGLFRGDDFPFNGGDGTGNYSAYFRIGSDIGERQNWRIGGYLLSGEAKSGRVTNEDTITFIGDMDLYVADLKYHFAPTGNAKNQELTLQGEYFYRNEKGTYEDTEIGSGKVNFDDNSSGWYLQTVYKFKPQWRIGLRYSELLSADMPAGLSGSILDAKGYNPKSYSTMIDWTNSEFSRIRLQYNHEELSQNNHDNQIILQYVMSFGAHPAHKY